MEQWQWAWLAGIFEGEGCIMDYDRTSIRLRVSMTDRDVIDTIQELCPARRGIHTREFEGKKTQYVWERSDRDDVREFLTGTLPYLHSRRRAKAEGALLRLESNLGEASRRTHCKRGHPLSGDNLYVQRDPPGRSCRTCRAEHTRKKDAKRRALREERKAQQSEPR